jgi:hypothetical protein
MSGLGSETRRMPSRRMLLLVGLYCCGAGMAEDEREWGERRRRRQGKREMRRRGAPLLPLGRQLQWLCLEFCSSFYL